MSKSEYFEGSIEVTPPLNFKELTRAREIAMTLVTATHEKKYVNVGNVFDSYLPLAPVVEEHDRPVDEGVLKVTQVTGFRPSRECDGYYSWRMKDLLEALIKGLPGHNWSGVVMSIDEYRQSAVKVVVKTGKDTSTVTEVTGKGVVVWENGDENTPVEDISG